MNKQTSKLEVNNLRERPVITAYKDMGQFIADMLLYRKQIEVSFSVLKSCRSLRRISPTLISLIVSGKRRITTDRIDELSLLLKLTVSEKFYLKNWVLQTEPKRDSKNNLQQKVESLATSRKHVSTHILGDWLNVYVKDCFQLPSIQNKPELLFEYLKPIATKKRLEKSLSFLLKEGHLRKLLNGKIEPEVNLTITDPKVPSLKIRKFHKSALKIASSALDLYLPQDRIANTLLIPLSSENYNEFLKLIEEFALKIQDFATTHKLENSDVNNDKMTTVLYQFLINLSPVGGTPQ